MGWLDAIQVALGLFFVGFVVALGLKVALWLWHVVAIELACRAFRGNK